MRRSRIEPVCEKKIRLVEEYSLAASAAFLAVSDLQSKVGAAFQAALDVSERSRVKCEKASIALRHHVSEHGC
jgi:hypothetical protein